MYYEATAKELKKLPKKTLKYYLKIVLDEIETAKERKKEVVETDVPFDYQARNLKINYWLRKIRKFQKELKEVL